MPSAKIVSAAFIRKGCGVELRSIPSPVLEEGSIMVSMKASGICGTDLEKLAGEYTASTILGHEVAGVVSESRSDVFNVGDMVVPHHHVACGTCYLCQHGAETMCDGFRNSNFVPGGFAEQFMVPRYNVERGGVHKFSSISHEEASFAEPLGCCIRGLAKVTNSWRNAVENVLVVGAGPIGLLHMELIRSKVSGVTLVAVDVSDTRLGFAEDNEGAVCMNAGIIEEGRFTEHALRLVDSPGYDIVIVATSNPTAFADAVKCVRKSGVVLLFGAARKGANYPIDLQSMLLNELTLLGSYATTEKEIDEALSMLQKGSINVRKFVTSKYRLSAIDAAMAAARSESQVKVLITN